MAGLVPAIHVFLLSASQDVDARDKPGHDEFVAAADLKSEQAEDPCEDRRDHGQHAEDDGGDGIEQHVDQIRQGAC